MTKECSESLSGRHRWVGADVAQGVYRPECADCHEDGDLGAFGFGDDKDHTEFVHIDQPGEGFFQINRNNPFGFDNDGDLSRSGGGRHREYKHRLTLRKVSLIEILAIILAIIIAVSIGFYIGLCLVPR
jgi:hypothetical protein